LAERCWGRGYATEALRAFLDAYWSRDCCFGVEIVLKAIVEEDNVGSCKVLEKCGFRESRRFVNAENGDRLVEMNLQSWPAQSVMK
jgi:RimJ/RimL family protein N-acetyltransferase